MKIYTKTGDNGTTGVYGGGRVLKCDLRIAAYGTIDELNSSIGLARAHALPPAIDAPLEMVQRHLFSIGAELATVDPDKHHMRWASAEPIRSLEQAIDDCESQLEPLKNFILPGGSLGASQLHVARTVCRRCEREVLRFVLAESADQTPPGSPIIVFLNRLSDLLFVMARVVNRDQGVADIIWTS